MKYLRWAERHLDVAGTSGDEVVAKCAFHDDSSPSMYVNVRKGVFFCQSCHASGTIDKLARQVNAALTAEPNLAALSDEIQALREMEVERFRVYPEAWLNQFDFPHRYWRQRGFSKSIIKRFRLGHDAERNCVTIPMRNSQGQPLGVIRRRLDDGYPRYIYPKGFAMKKYLWGEYEARRRGGTLVVVEGSLDAISVYEAGYAAVAMLGSRMTRYQATRIKSMGVRRVVAMTDDDDAGHHAVETIYDALDGVLLDVVDWSAVRYRDPAEAPTEVRARLIRHAIPYAEWYDQQ